MSAGEYLVRLDADDWFDPNLALVEATFLDQNPNVGLVFCDYHAVDPHGEIINTVRRAKVNDEVELLDRPCLAAGAMFRRRCYDAVGGYNETLRYQEDYDFWVKFIERFQVRNISLPLMYYRQHSSSMSRNFPARMKARREVKKKFVSENRQRFQQKVLAIIPARGDRLNGHKKALLPFGTSNLLTHSIEVLSNVDLIDRVVVSTEDQETLDVAEAAGAWVPFLRSRGLSGPGVPFEAVLLDLLQRLRRDANYEADIVVLMHPHSPFISADHVTEAIDTLLLYKTDSVIAVVEDSTYHWQVGRQGLTSVGYQKRVVRQDKDLIYKEAGGLYVFGARRMIDSGNILGKVIGHIELAPQEALRIETQFDYWVAQMVAQSNKPWLTA